MRVVYLYSGSREGVLEKVKKGEFHGNGFWGMQYLAEYGIDAEYIEIEHYFPSWLSRFFRKHVNNYFIHTILFWKLFSYDIVFTSAAFGTQLVHSMLHLRKPLWIMHDFSIIGLLGEGTTFRQKIFKFMVQKSAGIVTLSHDEKERLEVLFPSMKGKIEFIPFGVDLEFFKPLDVPEVKQILAVGFDPDRDWKTLIEATTDLNVPVILATREKRVQHLMPLPEYCTVKQFAPRDLVRAYAESAVVVVPLDTSARNNDAMGCSTLFEAMAVARPVVITRTKATESYVTHADNGMLVEEKNVSDLKMALQTLLNNDNLRKEIGKHAYTYAITHLNARVCTKVLADFFKRIYSDRSNL